MGCVARPNPRARLRRGLEASSLRDALRASIAALERASTDPEPLRRARAAMFPGSGPACTPSDDDAARTAAIRWVIEAGVWVSGIDASADGCLDTRDAWGRPLPRANGYASLSVGPPHPVERASRWLPEVGDPEWDAAPTSVVTVGTGGSMQGESLWLVLRRVRGEWRVVATSGPDSFTT